MKINNCIHNNKTMEETNINKTRKYDTIISYLKPNSDGVSEWYDRDYFTNTPLDLGNNGAVRYNQFFGDKVFKWETQRVNNKNTGKILKLRTNGFANANYTISIANRTINSKIKQYHLKQGEKNGCVACGSHSSLVVDHKNDLYNDPRVHNTSTQTNEDFQILCNGCNLRKREVSKKTRETQKRIGATTIPNLKTFDIDFIYGDETYDINDPNAMVGSYWYDPVAFMEGIKNKLIQQYITEQACNKIK